MKVILGITGAVLCVGAMSFFLFVRELGRFIEDVSPYHWDAEGDEQDEY